MSDSCIEYVCARGLLSLWLALSVSLHVLTWVLLPPRVGPGQAKSTSVAPKKKQGRTHIAQVQDEAVAIVEALPGHGYFGGTDHTPPFDLEESLYRHLIGYHVLESGCHASFLLGQGDSVSLGERVQRSRYREKSRVELKEILAREPVGFQQLPYHCALSPPL